MHRPLLRFALLAAAHFALTLLFLYLSLTSAARQLSGFEVRHAWDWLLGTMSIVFGSPLLSLAFASGVNLLHGSTLYTAAALNSALWAGAICLLGQWRQGRAAPA